MRSDPHHSGMISSNPIHISAFTCHFSLHAPIISLPSSFPQFFASAPDPHTTRALSSLTCTSSTSKLFGTYASVVKDCLGKHADVVARMGLEVDDVKELRDSLWVLEDAYRGDEEDFMSDEDTLGEDEEF